MKKIWRWSGVFLVITLCWPDGGPASTLDTRGTGGLAFFSLCKPIDPHSDITVGPFTRTYKFYGNCQVEYNYVNGAFTSVSNPGYEIIGTYNAGTGEAKETATLNPIWDLYTQPLTLSATSGCKSDPWITVGSAGAGCQNKWDVEGSFLSFLAQKQVPFIQSYPLSAGIIPADQRAKFQAEIKKKAMILKIESPKPDQVISATAQEKVLVAVKQLVSPDLPVSRGTKAQVVLERIAPAKQMVESINMLGVFNTQYGSKEVKLFPGKWKIRARISAPQVGEWCDWQNFSVAAEELLTILSPQADQSFAGDVKIQVKLGSGVTATKCKLDWYFVPFTPPGEWPKSPVAKNILSELDIKNHEASVVIPRSAFDQGGRWKVQFTVPLPPEVERGNAVIGIRDFMLAVLGESPQGSQPMMGRVPLQTPVKILTPKPNETFTGETAFQAQMQVPSGSPNTAGWEVEVEFEPQAAGRANKIKYWIPAAAIQGLKKFPLSPGKWRVHARVGKPQEGLWSEWVDFEVKTGELTTPLKAPEFKPIQNKPGLPPGRVLPK